MQRPNILLVHTDQHRWDALGANGNDEIRTPNLDRLADQGVTLDRYYVQAPVCMPSRASYMTGRYPSELGIYRNGVPLPQSVTTLPSMLSSAGYTSANLGKLHFRPHANRDHRQSHPDYGFDQLELSDEPGCYEDAYRAWVRRVAPEHVDDVSVGLPPAAERWQATVGDSPPIEHPEERFPKRPVPFDPGPDYTHSAFVADRTVEFLRTHRDDRPFLCVAGFYSPHSPWVVPQEHLDRYDRDDLSVPSFPPSVDAERDDDGEFGDETLRAARHGYYAMVSEVDDHVGHILDELDALGIAENTVVVFTSDHGELLGEHLRYGKGWPGYEPVSRVPCLVRWPAGVDDPGRVESGIVEAVDLVPTLLDCAGVQIPPDLQGESFLPALRGEEFAGRDDALLESHRGKTLRTDQFRYVLHRDGEESLYDVEADPGEYHDLAADEAYRETLAALRRRLAVRLTGVDVESARERTWAY